MRIKRTANAGVLLELDNKRILLDGVCQECAPYLGTPPALRDRLAREILDLVAFTHSHPDHYDPLFASDYLQNAAGPVLGPADIPCSIQEAAQLDSVTVTPVSSQHVGKSDGREHRSYIIRGSRCVWFMGDASALHWQRYERLPHPDVLIAPYGFLLGRGWDYCKQLSPGMIVLLHLPERENDTYGLWDAVEQTLNGCTEPRVSIPAIYDTIHIK